MIKLLETWQGIRPDSQNHIICAIYVNAMVTHRLAYVHRPALQNWMEHLALDCSVLPVSSHRSVPRPMLTQNIIHRRSPEHTDPNMAGMYPGGFYLLLYTKLYKSLCSCSLVNGISLGQAPECWCSGDCAAVCTCHWPPAF